MFVINYEHGVLIEDKIVWLYGGDELVPIGLAWFWCHAEDVDEILDWLFGYWCGKFDMSGEIKCRHDWPTLRLKGQLVMSWACVIGSSRDRDQKVDPGGWRQSAADLMVDTPRQARPEINRVVTVGWRPTNWSKINDAQRKRREIRSQKKRKCPRKRSVQEVKESFQGSEKHSVNGLGEKNSEWMIICVDECFH